MRFIRVHIFNKKYLLLNCVVYRPNIGFPYTINGLIFSEAHRSSCWQMFFKIGVLKIFENFRRNICVGVFLNKVTGLQACKFIKKKLQHRCFRVKFPKFLITSFFTKRLRWLLLRKIFERSAVYGVVGITPGGAWFRSIWKTVVLR